MNTHEIQKINPDEVYALEEMTFQAIYVPEWYGPLSRNVLNEPGIKAYYDNFGKEGDICFVATVDGAIIGAAWTRILDGNPKGYGNIGKGVPEFAVSLLPPYRNQGIGTALMQRLIAELKAQSYAEASLSVTKENYAVKMYLKLGFEVTAENKDDYIMVIKL